MKKTYNPPMLDIFYLNIQEAITAETSTDLISTVEGIEEW